MSDDRSLSWLLNQCTKAYCIIDNNDVFVRFRDGLTALHCAASRGHTRCIEILIKLCGAQTDLIDSNGCTALFYAVTLGHADATVKLLDLGADPNRQDRKGRSPGHCGCAKGQFETVKLLNGRGANLWLRNARGDLPVHEAAGSGRIELVQWLLQQKPSHINSSSNDGRTILHIAAGNDNIDMVKMLIESGADVNAVYRNAKNVVKTPLDCALTKGFRSTAKYVQMHEGLPANKLRLSGQKKTHSSILPELDDVKPLEFTKTEAKAESKERRHSNADSDSDQEGAHRRKKHRKCSHKRRTSSCGETFICHRIDESCEISRSKSTNELHRHRKSSKQCSFSTSSGSESSQSESSDEECCYHTKRKHRCYKKVKNKEREGSRKRHGSDGGKRGSESLDSGKKDKKKVEIASSAGGKRGSDSKALNAKAKGDVKAVKSASLTTNKRRPSSGKPLAVQRKPSQEDRAKSKTPELVSEPSVDVSKKSTTPEEVSEDDKVVKEIVTRAEVHDNLHVTDGDDGALTDATYTVEMQGKTEASASGAAEHPDCSLQVPTLEASKKVSFKSDEEIAEEKRLKTPEPPVEMKPAECKDAQDDSSCNEQYFVDEPPENIQRPKSQTPESVGSFTILADGDDADQKLREFDEMTQDEAFHQMEDEESEPHYFDDSSSLEKLPRRSRKADLSEDEGFRVADESKDQDSGIEPSPRAQRSKIPGLRSSLPSQRAFVITDGRPHTTRVEGRKPGDKNAVNMTTVTQSIQRNMRR